MPILRALGRVEAQIEALHASVRRIEDALPALEARVRTTERAIARIYTVGGMVAALWGAIVVLFEQWLPRR